MVVVVIRVATVPLAAIRVLEVDRQLWGFNGCHRVAAHERLGMATIKARMRKANSEVLRLHRL